MAPDLLTRLAQALAQAVASCGHASPAAVWPHCLRALQADAGLRAHIAVRAAGSAQPQAATPPVLHVHTATSAPGQPAATALLGAAEDTGLPCILVELSQDCASQVDMVDLACLVDCHCYEPACAAELQAIVCHAAQQAIEGRLRRPCYIRLGDRAIDPGGLLAAALADAAGGMSMRRTATGAGQRVQLLGGGDALAQVLRAAAKLGADHGFAADVWSVTSFSELARSALRHHAGGADGLIAQPGRPLRALAATNGPILGVTGRSRLLPELLRAHLPAGRHYATLGLPFPGSGAAADQPDPDGAISCEAIVQAALQALDARAGPRWQRPLSDAELVAQSCI